MRPADLRRLRGKADAAWREVVHAEAERVLAIADPAERLRAYAQLSRVLAEEGETLPADAADRILHSLRADVRDSIAPSPATDGKTTMATTWEVERRRLVVLHTLRALAPAGTVLAALAPFALGAWRMGMGLGGALTAFLTTGPGLAGVALALVGAAVTARLAGSANSMEGLAGLVVAAFLAGVAGLGSALL
jgi:hypothetical protein